MKIKFTVLLICVLYCFFACKDENSNKSTTTNTEETIGSDGIKAVEGIIKTNLNAKNNVKQGLLKANDAATITNWFPNALAEYSLDKSNNKAGLGEENSAKALYVYPNDPSKNITITVWDGNGSLVLFVNNMINTRLDVKGEEDNKEFREKVYVRKGRKSSERIIYQNNQVDISFEVEGRFYVIARSANNTIEGVWEVLDLLNFEDLK